MGFACLFLSALTSGLTRLWCRRLVNGMDAIDSSSVRCKHCIVAIKCPFDISAVSV